MEKGPRRMDYNDLARHLGVSHIRALSFASDIDALVHRRLLRYRDAKEEKMKPQYDTYLAGYSDMI